jgi:hypothetical protein
MRDEMSPRFVYNKDIEKNKIKKEIPQDIHNIKTKMKSKKVIYVVLKE